MRIIAVFLICLGLFGCKVTQAQYQKALDTCGVTCGESK